MQGIAEWLDSRETRALLAVLRHRKAVALQTFLAGIPVEPIYQGRAAELHDLEGLLLSGTDEVKRVFETALREQKAT